MSVFALLRLVHDLRVATTGQSSFMSASGSGSVKPKSPPPRSQSLALSPTAGGALQAQLRARLERPESPGSPQATDAAPQGLTRQVLQGASQEPSGSLRASAAIHEAKYSTMQPPPRLDTGTVVASELQVQARRNGPPPLPWLSPRQPDAVPVVSPNAAASAQVHTAAVLTLDEIEGHIAKMFASHLVDDVERNSIRQPDGAQRLSRNCNALFHMIDAQVTPHSRIHLYGQLVLQLLNYAGVDETLGWNKDRCDAANTVIKQIDQKVVSLHKVVSSMLVWVHVNKAARVMAGVGDPQNKAPGPNKSAALRVVHAVLERSLAVTPEQASIDLQEILLRAS